VRISKLTHTALLALLLGALGTPCLKAQEGNSPYSLAFKIRAGLHTGDMQKAHFDNKVMGFGAEIKREMFGAGQALSAELTWEYVPGRHHDVYPSDKYPWFELPLSLDPRFCYDDRKERGQGFNLRLAYSAPLPKFGPQVVREITEGWEWFAGLGIDRFKVATEVRYTLKKRETPSKGLFAGASYVEEASELVPGFFAGIKCKVNNDMKFELSLRNFGMRHYETRTEWYELEASQQTRTSEDYGRNYEISKTSTVRGWALEFAIAARL
jgi:hypothetical protein